MTKRFSRPPVPAAAALLLCVTATAIALAQAPAPPAQPRQPGIGQEGGGRAHGGKECARSPEARRRENHRRHGPDEARTRRQPRADRIRDVPGTPRQVRARRRVPGGGRGPDVLGLQRRGVDPDSSAAGRARGAWPGHAAGRTWRAATRRSGGPFRAGTRRAGAWSCGRSSRGRSGSARIGSRSAASAPAAPQPPAAVRRPDRRGQPAPPQFPAGGECRDQAAEGRQWIRAARASPR